jgi:hypothetical protein
LTNGSHEAIVFLSSPVSSTCRDGKQRRGKEGTGSCNARGKIPPAPYCCRARQAPRSAPQAHHATIRARSTFSHAPRARDRHGPPSALPPCHRQPPMESEIGIINSNHASSDCPSPSQGSISTLHAARLPSRRPPCHGRARSIKLHPMPNPALSITVPPPPWWHYRCPHRKREGRREEAGREGKEGKTEDAKPTPPSERTRRRRRRQTSSSSPRDCTARLHVCTTSTHPAPVSFHLATHGTPRHHVVNTGHGAASPFPYRGLARGSHDPHTLITCVHTHDTRMRWPCQATGAQECPRHASAPRAVAMPRPRHGKGSFLM